MSTSLIGNTGIRSKAPKGYNYAQIPTMSPESYDLWRNLIGRSQEGTLSGVDLLGKMASGDESAFQGLEKPYYSALQKMGGDIASRFSGGGTGFGGGGSGAMSALGSSGFRNAIAGSAKNLSEQLGSQRLGLQKDAIQQLMQLSEMLLGKQPYQTGLTQKQPSGWQKLFGGLGQGIGNGLGLLPGLFF